MFRRASVVLLCGVAFACGCKDEPIGRVTSIDFDSGVEDVHSVTPSTDAHAGDRVPESGPGRDAGADAPVETSDSSVPDAGSPTEADAREAGTSLYCGDGIRGATEECDDGNDDVNDFCAACIVRDRLTLASSEPSTLPVKRRFLPASAHAVAAGADGVAVLFSDPDHGNGALSATFFQATGARIGDGAGLPVDERDPFLESAVAGAALPGNRFALAWTTYGNRAEIVLRSFDATRRELAAARGVSSRTEGDQFLSDAVWTGKELVVAWTEAGESPARPHSFLRRFDADLAPLAAEERLDGASPSDAVLALTAFRNGAAAAWVVLDENALLTYRVRGAGTEWSVGPFPTSEARASLAALDDDHLLLMLEGLLEDADAGTFTRRLFAMVLDTAAPGAVRPFLIEPLRTDRPDVFSVEQSQMALAVAGGSAFIAWRERRPSGEYRLALKQMRWRSENGSKSLDLAEPELDLAHDAARRNGDQQHPVLARAPWGPGESLFIAWEDHGKSFGPDQWRPDIVTQSIPLPLSRGTESNDHEK